MPQGFVSSPFVLFFGVQRPLLHEATFLLHYDCTLDGRSERGTAYSQPFEVFTNDPNLYCFAGDSTLK